MPKRILVVSQHYWPENFRITDICKGFAESGLAVDVLCGLPNYPTGEWFEGYCAFGPIHEVHEGIEVFRTGEIRRKGNTGLRIFLNYISFPIAALCNLPRLHGRHYDGVFCYNTSPVLMMLPAIVYAKLHRVPLTTYVLDLWPENLYSVLPLQNKTLRSIARSVSHFLYRRSDRLIAMSPALGKKLQAIAPKVQHTVIPQYCESFYFTDVSNLALSARFADKCKVLFAGNVSPAQDLSLLVACAKKLQQAQRSDLHFVMVGDGMSLPALKAEIEKENVAHYFTFEGQQPVTAIPAYHSLCDILFCALAKSDDLGLTIPGKITSYLAAGKACLVAIDGEGSRVVQEANAGLTCAAGDVNALYKNMITLADMPKAQREALGANGRAYCRTFFGREALLQALAAFILDEKET